MSSSKCCVGGTGSCAGKRILLVLMSLLFMVAMSGVFGFLLALPVTLFVYLFLPSIFGSFALALLCVTSSFTLLFVVVAALSRMVHISLEGMNYVHQTFYYDFLKQ